MMKRIVVALALVVMAAPAMCQNTDDPAARGKALAATMGEYLLVLYMCHKYTGIEQYFAGKSTSISLSERIYGDRNKAVLQVDAMEQSIKNMKPEARLEGQFDSDRISHSDRVGTCVQMTTEVKDKFEVEQAKSGLL